MHIRVATSGIINLPACMAGSNGRELAPFPDADQSIEQHDKLSSTPQLPSRKKVSLACLACRRRRTKVCSSHLQMLDQADSPSATVASLATHASPGIPSVSKMKTLTAGANLR